MKKIILALVLISVVCCGCWKTEDIVMTQYGIFESWHSATASILNESVNPAFISNAWINGNDSVRRAIEDQYFPNTRIRHEGGDEYGIYEGTSLLLLINTGGKAIDDTDANWLITRYSNYTISSEPAPSFFTSGRHTRLELRHTGDNEWTVNLDSATCDGSTSDWILSAPGTETPVTLNDIPYTLSGGGIYLFDGTSFDSSYTYSPVTMRYTFSEPLLHKLESRALFSAGIMDIILSKQDCDDKTVHVEFTPNGTNISRVGR